MTTSPAGTSVVLRCIGYADLLATYLVLTQEAQRAADSLEWETYIAKMRRRASVHDSMLEARNYDQ